MNHLAHIADRVINRPLMLLPEKLALISSVLEGRIGIDASDLKAVSAEGLIPTPDASRFVGTFEAIDPENPRAGKKPYRTTSDGTAIIPIIGSLVNRGSFMDVMSGILSYERLKRDIGMAANDKDVRTIVLDIDSPGGEAVGAFEAAAVVADAGKVKPVTAIANGLCCSAAYAIASAATRIVASPSSVVGSVGVVLLHLDNSHRLHEDGIVPTLIQAGARKTDGNPYKPLTDEVRGELKAEVERFMDLFVAGVAAGRAGMTEESIRATEARTYIGADAVEVGFADVVGTFESVIQELARGGGSGRSAKPTRGTRMSDTTNQPEASGITQSQVDAAVEAARTEARAGGVAEGVAAERGRFKAVTSSEHYAGREKAALHMLTTTDMAAEAITGVLAGLPADAPAAPAASSMPAGRSQDAPGGLAVVSSNSPEAPAASEFEKGKQLAARALHKTA